MEQGNRDFSMGAEGLPDEAPSPLAEQWPYLRFLGLGVWWAWIWLCYYSTRLVGLFPDEMRPSFVLQMYLLSTAAIGATMLAAGVFNRVSTRLVDSRGAVLFAGVVAALATGALAWSGTVGGGGAFTVSAVLTGACTGALCLKVGRLYGTVNLSDSLTAGAVSLVLAGLLYFVGLGIPQAWSVVYVAVLPLLAALLLCMPHDDPYEAARSLVPATDPAPVPSSILGLYARLVAASAVVALTAGVARGVSSSIQASEGYGLEGSVIVAVIGVAGVALAWLVNRMAAQRKGARIAYAALMIFGIGLMLATGFGVPISYLSIGKELLWLVLSCLMAFMAFRFGFSSVRAFALGQGVYYLVSAAGWGLGALIAPAYGDVTVRMAVGAIMAFVVVIVLTLLFTERDIKAILLAPVLPQALAGANAAEAGISAAAANPRSAKAGSEEPWTAIPEAATTSAAEVAAEESAEEDRRCALLEGRYGLSAREVQIMDLFSQGRSANWIADALFISKNTVRSHLRAIYTKLDVHTRQELIDAINNLN